MIIGGDEMQLDQATIDRLNDWCAGDREQERPLFLKREEAKTRMFRRHWGFVVSERGIVAITLNYRAGLVESSLTCEGSTPAEAADNAIAMAEVGIRAIEGLRRRQREGG